MNKNIIVIILLVCGLLVVQDARANTLEEYNSEVVSYIETKYGVLPANTKFKCVNKVLYKSGYVQREYTGKAQTCKTVKMTRGEREEGIILNLF